MQQPYGIATPQSYDKINQAWYAREDQVSHITFTLSKEKLDKDQREIKTWTRS